MKDFGAKPPAIIRTEADAAFAICKTLAHQAKESTDALGRALLDAKEKCPHGEWEKRLKRAGIGIRTAQVVMKNAREQKRSDCAFELVDEEPETESSTAITDKPLCTDCRENGVRTDCPDCWSMRQAAAPTTPSQPELFGGSGSGEPQPAALPKGWKKCPLCKAKKARNSAKCDACKTLNAPPTTTAETPEVEEKPEETGPDPTDYNSFWKRIGKTLGKRIKQMRNALVIPRQDLDAARDAYAALSKFISKHAAAETKPQEAGTCKKCGAEVVWTTTSSHSRIPLDVKPGGGVWEVIEGVAHFCDWDKDAAKFRFRCHSARCVSNKPIPD